MAMAGQLRWLFLTCLVVAVDCSSAAAGQPPVAAGAGGQTGASASLAPATGEGKPLPKVLLAITMVRDFRLLDVIMLTLKSMQAPSLVTFEYTVVLAGIEEEAFKQLQEKLKGHLQLMRADGNIHRGAVRNAVVKHFHAQRKWDFLYLHDGNDFLYLPFAMSLSQALVSFQPDMLLLPVQGCDILKLQAEEFPHFIPGEDKSYINHHSTYTLDIITEDSFRLNPFNSVSVDLPNIFTRGFHRGEEGVRLRLVALSLRAADVVQQPLFDEEMLIHEDFPAQMQTLELVKTSTLRIVFLWNTHLFLRNSEAKNAIGNAAANTSLDLDNKILVERYQAYSKFWSDGTVTLPMHFLNDSYVKRTNFWSHKGDFLKLTHAYLHRFVRQR